MLGTLANSTMQDDRVLLGIAVIGLLGLISAISAVSNIIRNFRREPGADATFATKNELREVKSELTREIQRVDSHTQQRIGSLIKQFDVRLAALEKTIQHGFHEFAKELGEISGWIKAQRDHHDHDDHRR